MGLPLANEIRLMAAPFAVYRRLLADPPRRGLAALVVRPLTIALVIGAFVTLANTGEAFPSLLIGSVIAWSWVPLLQLAIATPLTAVCRRRTVPLASALDLFFAAHAPWSLWLLGLTAWAMLRLPDGLGSLLGMGLVLRTALVPIAWTCWLIFAYGRVVLGLRVWQALAWMLVYQAVLWQCAHFYVGAATFRLWPFAMYGGWLG